LSALRTAWLAAAYVALGLPSAGPPPKHPRQAPRVLDDFEQLSAWSVHPSDGVTARISSDSGVHGRGMRVDFDFHGHAGYAIVRRALDLSLPDDYAFAFALRGIAPPENLEFKLVDSTGSNVWWNNARDVRFPRDWQRLVRRHRDITFAWGPRGGGDLRHVASLEIAVTAGSHGGGRGTLWLDDLTFEKRDRPRATYPPPVIARSAPGARPWLTLDFGAAREIGGLTIDWARSMGPRRYVVERSDDRSAWSVVYEVPLGRGARDYVPLPGLESRYVRVRLLDAAPDSAIRSVKVEAPAFAATPTALFESIAARARRGSYPRGFVHEQSYWTVVGVPGDDVQALVSGDGAVEPFRGGFSLEPFLRLGDTLFTWADVTPRQSLPSGGLPIPSVQWRAGEVGLTTTVAAVGVPSRSSLVVRYRVSNAASTPRAVTLFLAARPLQVNPPSQTLGWPGGAATVSRVRWAENALHLVGDEDEPEGERRVISITPPSSVGAAAFAEGSVVDYLRAGAVPPRTDVADPAGHASAALAYRLEIPATAVRDVYVEIPLHPDNEHARSIIRDARAAESALSSAARDWATRLDRVSFVLPPEARRLVECIDANLAWLLIERRGDALRPGTRAYARSWIRDGALMSAALDRLGYADLSRRFALWYAPYQFSNGKVPCCVDERGADPVDENDSHGEFIYLVAQYWRTTRDRATVARLWPHIDRAVAWIDALRRQRLTAAYDTGSMRAYRGLLPQSISHEGYSAKPMHSYWDDLFALRGLSDATELAAALGKRDDAKRIGAIRDAFRADLYASIRLAMSRHAIDYLPGSVELGDFDATSTTVFVSPGGELGGPLDAVLRRTFDKYWRDFEIRRARATWDAYTPYELRAVGTFVRLGEPERARQVLEFLFAGQRPAGWRQWAEVVVRDSAAPRFIGDMPHAWVASDFLRSALDLFAYERASDSALVLAAGIPESWAASATGVGVRELRTYEGPLTYLMTVRGDTVKLRLGGGLHLPPGGIVIRSPVPRPIAVATVDRTPTPATAAGEVVVRHAPADVVIIHRK
jgi:hypothetical protein